MKQGNKKLKKNADQPVDKLKENLIDPKYKTELCKTFEETNFCPYGYKCRFAHGKEDLFSKSTQIFNYKQKECKSFFKDNFCNYGVRCLFKHSIPLEHLEWSFYSSLLSVREGRNVNNNVNTITDYDFQEILKNNKRLDVFMQLTNSSPSFKKDDTNLINQSFNKSPFNLTVFDGKLLLNSTKFKIPSYLINIQSISNNETKSNTSEMRSP